MDEFDAFPHNLPIIKNLKEINFHSDVTFLVGENGSGKSTLIEAIAVLMKLNPEGGSRNFNFSTFSSHSNLHEHLEAVRSYALPRDSFFLRAESFYNVASNIEKIGDRIQSSYGGKSLHEQSHGESFWSLLNKRLFGKGLYIFDEPESALSPMRQMSALARIHDLVKKESQFIIATHSPILLAYPNANIYEIKGSNLELVKYEETSHYQVYKDFLNRYEKQVKILLR